MAVLSTDIKLYMSGGAGNSDPNLCLGGAISSTEITSDLLQNLFDNVSAQEATDGDNEYRCIYVKNVHATDTLYAPSIWKSAEDKGTPTPDIVYLSLIEAKNTTAQVIANESTEPTGPSWQDQTTKGIALGDLAFGDYRAVWLKRAVPAGASSKASRGCTLKVEGETA